MTPPSFQSASGASDAAGAEKTRGSSGAQRTAPIATSALINAMNNGSYDSSKGRINQSRIPAPSNARRTFSISDFPMPSVFCILDAVAGLTMRDQPIFHFLPTDRCPGGVRFEWACCRR
jgi:hypothetical protein